MASHVLRSGDQSSPDAHFNLMVHFLFFLFFAFAQEICTIHLLHHYINIVCSFFSTDKFMTASYTEFIIIFNSMIHYHKLHSSTEAKHTCHNCLISDAVLRYTKAAGSNKLKLAWGKPRPNTLGA